MAERRYTKGLNNMNCILAFAARKDRPVTGAEVARHIDTSMTSALYYLHQLTAAKKMERCPWNRGIEPMMFKLLDATPYPLPEPEQKPVNTRKRSAAALEASKNPARRRVKHTKAQQIGMVRDALVAALFGSWRAA